MYLCDCSLGNGCDRVTGTCQCNPCYTGLNCETRKCAASFIGLTSVSSNSFYRINVSFAALGADCIRQFLEYPEKVLLYNNSINNYFFGECGRAYIYTHNILYSKCYNK